MPLTKHIRLPVTDEEFAQIEGRTGGITIAAYLRKLLGLPARRQGRPPAPKKPSKG